MGNAWSLSEHSLTLIDKLSESPLTEEQIKHLDHQLYKVNKRNKGSWCSDEKTEMLLILAELTKPKTCVEIGIFSGSSLLPILHTLKHQYSGHVFGIDSWSTDDILQEIPEDDPNYTWWKTLDIKLIKKTFFQMIINYEYEDFTTVLVHKSSECVNLIPNEIDFIHFHGNMGKETSLEDVTLYLPKVKSGGYILFSDMFCVINKKHTKMEAMWHLLDHCDVIYEIENSNALLLKKR